MCHLSEGPVTCLIRFSGKVFFVSLSCRSRARSPSVGQAYCSRQRRHTADCIVSFVRCAWTARCAALDSRPWRGEKSLRHHAEGLEHKRRDSLNTRSTLLGRPSLKVWLCHTAGFGYLEKYRIEVLTKSEQTKRVANSENHTTRPRRSSWSR